MSGISGLIVVGVGTAINTVYAVHTSPAHPKATDPFPQLIGGVILGTLTVGMDSIFGNNVGTLFGILFLIGSFVLHGTALIDTFTAALASPPPKH